MRKVNGKTHIRRVHRQHNSLVVTLPKLLCKEHTIQRGDYLEFTSDAFGMAINVRKVQIGVAENAKDKADKRG
jgi:antitoxin component of MazEF toxin-antitoxin module